MGYNRPATRRNQENIFRDAGEIVEENMDAKQRTKLYVASAMVITITVASLIMMIRKIIRK